MKAHSENIISELKTLHRAVADTSTLIYLERIHLLTLAGTSFQLLIPPDVVQEFGRVAPECTVCGEPSAEGADQAVIQLAVELHLPVLSEDRKLLMSSRRLGLKYYNTLMILLALLLQQRISCREYEQAYADLRKTARYSPAVWQVGEQVFSLYVR